MSDYWHLVLGMGVRACTVTPLYAALHVVAVYQVREPGGQLRETAVMENGAVVCSCEEKLPCSHGHVTLMHYEHVTVPKPAA